jgi:hypothetical protein
MLIMTRISVAAIMTTDVTERAKLCHQQNAVPFDFFMQNPGHGAS